MSWIFAFVLSPIGRYVMIAVASVALIGGAYLKGDVSGFNKGKAEVQTKWDAANAADIKRGNDARREAEQYVAKPPTILYRTFHPGSVPNDRWDRDKGAVRAVAPLDLLRDARHSTNGAGHPGPQHDGSTAPVLVTVPSCAMISWAISHLPQDKLCEYQKHATPAQIEAGKKCKAGEIKCPAG